VQVVREGRKLEPPAMVRSTTELFLVILSCCEIFHPVPGDNQPLSCTAVTAAHRSDIRIVLQGRTFHAIVCLARYATLTTLPAITQ